MRNISTYLFCLILVLSACAPRKPQPLTTVVSHCTVQRAQSDVVALCRRSDGRIDIWNKHGSVWIYSGTTWGRDLGLLCGDCNGPTTKPPGTSVVTPSGFTAY